MKLKSLLKGLAWDGKINYLISTVVTDSRKAVKNSLFIAITGVNTDGHLYISDAIQNGVVAVVYEKDNIDKKVNDVAYIKVVDARKAAAIIASNYYGNAHKKMKIIGITGTNGKTTTSEMVFQLLKKLGKRVGLISTVSAKFLESEIDTGYHVTTPDALSLHKIIAEMYKKGCEYLVIETTSHALDQHRTWGINFMMCAVTNVTPEHLDYHKTFNSYLSAKAKIFEQSKFVILNKFDPSLKELIKKLPEAMKYEVVDYKDLNFPRQFTKKFPGQYNLENGAIACAIVKKLTKIDALKHLVSLERVKGRMEVIRTGKDFSTIIDFAHDAASLEKVLNVARKLTKNRLILVFGCAGLRDKTKRPKMGYIAIKLADKTIVTAEDPRTEKLASIIKEIENGVIKAGGKISKDYFIIEDRQKAINFAISKLAEKGDLVLITGKGHEKSMCFGSKEYSWSDQHAVKKAIKSRFSKDLKNMNLAKPKE